MIDEIRGYLVIWNKYARTQKTGYITIIVNAKIWVTVALRQYRH